MLDVLFFGNLFGGDEGSCPQRWLLEGCEIEGLMKQTKLSLTDWRGLNI